MLSADLVEQRSDRIIATIDNLGERMTNFSNLPFLTHTSPLALHILLFFFLCFLFSIPSTPRTSSKGGTSWFCLKSKSVASAVINSDTSRASVSHTSDERWNLYPPKKKWGSFTNEKCQLLFGVGAVLLAILLLL